MEGSPIYLYSKNKAPLTRTELETIKINKYRNKRASKHYNKKSGKLNSGLIDFKKLHSRTKPKNTK